MILDISSPTAPKLVYQIDLGSAAIGVTAVGSTALCCVGKRRGDTGGFVGPEPLQNNVQCIGAVAYDVRIGGETLFAVSDTELFSYSIADGFLDFRGRITTTAQPADPLTGRKRIFVGNGYALVSCWIGYDRIDVSDPTAMKLIGAAAKHRPGFVQADR